MRTVKLVWVVFYAVLLLGVPLNAKARDLVERLDSLLGPEGITLRVSPAGPFPNHAAHFSSASLSTLGLLTKQLAATAADFPAISTAPGFTYHYNPQLQIFERSSTSLGPVFVERPQTIGRGKFDFGVSYLYVDFTELNGHDLDSLGFVLHHGDCCVPINNPPKPENPIFEEDTINLAFDKFTLRSHVITLSGTYGLTDRWDINILLPIVFTSLDLRAHAHINNTFSSTIVPGGIHFFPNGSLDKTFSSSGDKTGVGDLQLRTKYHLLELNGFNLASGLTLRIPTGEENDFQGLGDPTLTPFLSLAQEYDRLDVHASGGMQLNLDDSDRSRVRYGGGMTLQIIEQLALMVDVIGSSNVVKDRVSTLVPDFLSIQGPGGIFMDQRIERIVSKKVHTDIVDLSVGLKANPFRSAIVFVNFFVPLNHDGLRADFIPTAGVEVSF